MGWVKAVLRTTLSFCHSKADVIEGKHRMVVTRGGMDGERVICGDYDTVKLEQEALGCCCTVE